MMQLAYLIFPLTVNWLRVTAHVAYGWIPNAHKGVWHTVLSEQIWNELINRWKPKGIYGDPCYKWEEALKVGEKPGEGRMVQVMPCRTARCPLSPVRDSIAIYTTGGWLWAALGQNVSTSELMRISIFHFKAILSFTFYLLVTCIIKTHVESSSDHHPAPANAPGILGLKKKKPKKWCDISPYEIYILSVFLKLSVMCWVVFPTLHPNSYADVLNPRTSECDLI